MKATNWAEDYSGSGVEVLILFGADVHRTLILCGVIILCISPPTEGDLMDVEPPLQCTEREHAGWHHKLLRVFATSRTVCRGGRRERRKVEVSIEREGQSMSVRSMDMQPVMLPTPCRI